MNIKFSILISLFMMIANSSIQAVDAPTIIEEGTSVVLNGKKQLLSLGETIIKDTTGTVVYWFKVTPKPIPFLTTLKNRLTNHPILIMGALACVGGLALLLTKKKLLRHKSTTEIEEQGRLFLFAQE